MLKRVFNSILILLLVFGYFASAFISKLLSKRKASPPTLMFSFSASQIFELSNLEDIITVLSEDRFRSLFSLDDAIWQVRSMRVLRPSKNGLVFDIARHILINCLTWRCFLSSFLGSMKSCISSNASLREFSLATAKENFIDYYIWTHFFKNSPSRVTLITTLSSGNQLPVCFKDEFSSMTHRIMLWYSNNSFQIKPRDKRIHVKHPLAKFSKEIDLHLVWSERQRRELDHLQLGKSQVVGPIHLQKRVDIKPKFIEANVFKVAFFDVVPLHNTSGENYYNSKFCTENLSMCVSNLFDLCEEFNVKLHFLLKSKQRFVRNYHDHKYQELISDLVSSRVIHLAESDINHYELISDVDLVMGLPYTSPVQLAKSLNIKSAYVSLNDFYWDIPMEFEGIEILHSLKSLEDYLRNTLSTITKLES